MEQPRAVCATRCRSGWNTQGRRRKPSPGLPPKVAILGGTYVGMRLGELTRQPHLVGTPARHGSSSTESAPHSRPVIYSPPGSGSGIGRYDSGVASAYGKDRSADPESQWCNSIKWLKHLARMRCGFFSLRLTHLIHETRNLTHETHASHS
jgi:hypothetical protein